MRTIKQELYKLFSKKTLLFLMIVLSAVNIVSLFWFGNSINDFNYSIPDSAYRQLRDDLSVLDPFERQQFIEEKLYAEDVYKALMTAEKLGNNLTEHDFPILEQKQAQKYIKQYTDGIALTSYTDRNDSRFLNSVLAEMQMVYGYNDYLDYIQEQAERIGVSEIFGNKDAFAGRNSTKIAEVYSKMPKQDLPFEITFGISAAIGNVIADICILLISAFAVLTLICSEKENGAFTLLRTLKKGRIHLMLCKITTLFIFCGVAVLVFTGGSLIVCGLRFGFSDLSIPIQSVSGFLGCTLQCNLGTYLLICFAVKTVAFFVISMMIFTVSIFAKNNIAVYAVSGGIIAVQLVMFISINRLSVLSPIKYLNIAAITQTNEILGSYQSLNFFGYPFSLTVVSAVFTAILATGFIIVSVVGYAKQKNTVYSSYNLSAFFARINPFNKGISVSLWKHELYKIFVGSRGIVTFLMMIAVCCVMYSQFLIFADEDDGYFRHYVAEYGGVVTAETDSFVISETERYEQLEVQLEKNGGLAAELAMRGRTGFETFCEYYSYAKENPSAEIVYDTGFELLFNNRVVAEQLFVLFIFMSLMFAPVFSSDSKTMPLILSTKHGRRRDMNVRFILCGIITAVMFAAAHLPVYMRISSYFGLNGIDAAVQSVGIFRSLPLSITILQYIVLRYLIMLVICFVIMRIMLFLSRRINSPSGCVLILLAISALPAAVVWILG